MDWGRSPNRDMVFQDDEELREEQAEELIPFPLNMLDPKKVTYMGASLKEPLSRLIMLL